MPLVAFRIGSQPVFTYSVLVASGLIAGALVLALEGQRRGWRPVEVLEVLAWALVAGLVGGRLAYAWTLGLHGEPFPRWLEQPWGEGLVYPAALLAGALALAALAALRRRPCFEALGAAVPGLALGQALGWLGAAAHGLSAGIGLPTARWAPHLRDLYGLVLPRFPLQYLASALSLLAFALLTWGLAGDRQRVACYASLSGWGLLALSWGAERRVPFAAGLSLDQLGYLALGLVGVGALLAGLRRPAAVAAQARAPKVKREA